MLMAHPGSPIFYNQISKIGGIKIADYISLNSLMGLYVNWKHTMIHYGPIDFYWGHIQQLCNMDPKYSCVHEPRMSWVYV